MPRQRKGVKLYGRQGSIRVWLVEGGHEIRLTPFDIDMARAKEEQLGAYWYIKVMDEEGDLRLYRTRHLKPPIVRIQYKPKRGK